MGRAATTRPDEAFAFSPALAGVAPAAAKPGEVSYNLAGQRLGRKGRVTRERILAAALELIDDSEEEAFTLGAVARRAGLGMSSLYNYFSDQTELLLAVLEPIMATAEGAYMGLMRERWPDGELPERTKAFVVAYSRFWSRHAGLLHLRNMLADQFDVRMIHHRINSTRPLIDMLAQQMSRDGIEPADTSMASVLMTGIERSATHATDRLIPRLTGLPTNRDPDRYLIGSARLLELAIRDARGL